MSCPIPQRIVNPHYKKLSRDNGVPLESFQSNDDFVIHVPCGMCINCLKSKGNAWSVRLQYHYNHLPLEARQNSYFVTLTLSDDYIDYDKSLLVRRFLERVRKVYKKSFQHWIISEYGERTNRFHFHGLFFDLPFPRSQLLKYWKYGHVVIKPLTPRRIGYITTYVNKNLRDKNQLIEDPRYRQKIWCSPGLGKSIVDDKKVVAHIRKDGHPVPLMRTLNNFPIAIPSYYRKKLFTEDELLTLKTLYFFNQSNDVIPDPPYRIGNRKFTDYTLYQQECENLREKRYLMLQKYGKRKQ